MHQAQPEMLSGVMVTDRFLSLHCGSCVPPTYGCGLWVGVACGWHGPWMGVACGCGLWVGVTYGWVWPVGGCGLSSLKVCLGSDYSLALGTATS